MARTHRRITGKLARPFPASILFRDFEELRSNPAPLMSRIHPKLVKEPQPKSLISLGWLASQATSLPPFDAILPESAVANLHLWSRLFLALPLSSATYARGLSFSLWRPHTQCE
jgi:hypothetical protein